MDAEQDSDAGSMEMLEAQIASLTLEFRQSPRYSTVTRIESLLNALYSPSTSPKAAKAMSNKLTEMQNHPSIFQVLKVFIDSETATQGSLIFAASALNICVHRDFGKLPPDSEGSRALKFMTSIYLESSKIRKFRSTAEKVVDAAAIIYLFDMFAFGPTRAMDTLHVFSQNTTSRSDNQCLRILLLRRIGDYFCSTDLETDNITDRVLYDIANTLTAKYSTWKEKKAAEVLSQMVAILETGIWAEKVEAIRCIQSWLRCGPKNQAPLFLLDWIIVEQTSEAACEALLVYFLEIAEEFQFQLEAIAKVIERCKEVLQDTALLGNSVIHNIAEFAASIANFIAGCYALDTFGSCRGMASVGTTGVSKTNITSLLLCRCVRDEVDVFLHFLSNRTDRCAGAGLQGLDILLSVDEQTIVAVKHTVAELAPDIVTAAVLRLRIFMYPASPCLSYMEDDVLKREDLSNKDMYPRIRGVLERCAALLGLSTYFKILNIVSLDFSNSTSAIITLSPLIHALSYGSSVDPAVGDEESFMGTMSKLGALADASLSSEIRASSFMCLSKYAESISKHESQALTTKILRASCTNLDDADCRLPAVSAIICFLPYNQRGTIPCRQELISGFYKYWNMTDSFTARLFAGALVEAFDREHDGEAILSLLAPFMTNILADHKNWEAEVTRNLAVLAEAARSIESQQQTIIGMIGGLLPALLRVAQNRRLICNDEVAKKMRDLLVSSCLSLSNVKEKKDSAPILYKSVRLATDILGYSHDVNLELWSRCLVLLLTCIRNSKSYTLHIPESSDKVLGSLFAERVETLAKALGCLVDALIAMNALQSSLTAQTRYLGDYFNISESYIDGSFGLEGNAAALEMAGRIGSTSVQALSCNGSSGRLCIQWWGSVLMDSNGLTNGSAVADAIIKSLGSADRIVSEMLHGLLSARDRYGWIYPLLQALRAIVSRQSGSEKMETRREYTEMLIKKGLEMRGSWNSNRLTEEESYVCRVLSELFGQAICSKDFPDKLMYTVNVVAGFHDRVNPRSSADICHELRSRTVQGVT